MKYDKTTLISQMAEEDIKKIEKEILDSLSIENLEQSIQWFREATLETAMAGTLWELENDLGINISKYIGESEEIINKKEREIELERFHSAADEATQAFERLERWHSSGQHAQDMAGLTEPVADWHVVFHALKGVGYDSDTMEPLEDHWSMHESKEDAVAYYERVQDLRNFHSGGYARITEGSDW
jgi:hypothetical protein|tara:strand:- start:1330 stop:1884 length:555 start_codon:yes stop_codon:yes gene_type:complete